MGFLEIKMLTKGFVHIFISPVGNSSPEVLYLAQSGGGLQ